MILVDTAIWVDYLRNGHQGLQHLLEQGVVLGHPWVAGELALGHLARRREILRLLASLPAAVVVGSDEMLLFVERQQLMGRGIGYIDVQLLAATRLTADATIWTSDKRLADAASQLGLAVDPALLGGAR